MESKEQNKQQQQQKKTKAKQTHIYRGQTGDCQRGEELGAGWKKWKGEEVQINSYYTVMET